MATYPWRFQADLKPGDTDPNVTVFVGDMHTNSVTGEEKIYQDTFNPEIVKLSELASFVATGMAEGITRSPAPQMPGAPAPEAEAKSTREKK